MHTIISDVKITDTKLYPIAEICNHAYVGEYYQLVGPSEIVFCVVESPHGNGVSLVGFKEYYMYVGKFRLDALFRKIDSLTIIMK